MNYEHAYTSVTSLANIFNTSHVFTAIAVRCCWVVRPTQTCTPNQLLRSVRDGAVCLQRCGAPQADPTDGMPKGLPIYDARLDLPAELAKLAGSWPKGRAVGLADLQFEVRPILQLSHVMTRNPVGFGPSLPAAAWPSRCAAHGHHQPAARRARRGRRRGLLRSGGATSAHIKRLRLPFART